MIKDIKIDIPTRPGVPKTLIFAKIFTLNNASLGQRDVMILVPGGPGNNHTMYDTKENSLAKSLLPALDIILFDPRGCGNSEPSAIEFCSLEHYVDDIEAIRRYLAIPAQKFIVFGQSYGSIAAVNYAIKYPNNLKKLFLIAGAANSEFLEEAKQCVAKIGTPEQIFSAEKLWQGTISHDEAAKFIKIMSPLYSYKFVATDDTSLEIPYNVDILNYGFGTFLKKFDFCQSLEKIICPTLILWGENEWIMSKNQVEQLYNGIVNSQLIIYNECGHMLWIDQWERFLDDAFKFLCK